MVAAGGRLVDHERGQWKPAWKYGSSPLGLAGRERRLVVGRHDNLLFTRADVRCSQRDGGTK